MSLPKLDKAVELYIDAIYVIPYEDDESNTKYRFYMITRKRRDVDPYSVTAGDYITNIEGAPNGENDKTHYNHYNYHSQLIGRKFFNNLLALSGYEPLEDKWIKLAADTHRAVVNKADQISFVADVRPDPDHQSGYGGLPTYIVSKSTVKESEYDFDWPGHEAIWEQRSQLIQDKFEKLFKIGKGDEVIKFKERPDYAQGQYTDVVSSDQNPGVPAPNESDDDSDTTNAS